MRAARDDESIIEQGLEVLQRNTNALVELISDLLDTSRIVAGTLTLDLQDVDLKQVVRTSVETLRVQAAEKGVFLESFVEVPEEVSCTVWGDEARLLRFLFRVFSPGRLVAPSPILAKTAFLHSKSRASC